MRGCAFFFSLRRRQRALSVRRNEIGSISTKNLGSAPKGVACRPFFSNPSPSIRFQALAFFCFCFGACSFLFMYIFLCRKHQHHRSRNALTFPRINPVCPFSFCRVCACPSLPRAVMWRVTKASVAAQINIPPQVRIERRQVYRWVLSTPWWPHVCITGNKIES